MSCYCNMISHRGLIKVTMPGRPAIIRPAVLFTSTLLRVPNLFCLIWQKCQHFQKKLNIFKWLSEIVKLSKIVKFSKIINAKLDIDPFPPWKAGQRHVSARWSEGSHVRTHLTGVPHSQPRLQDPNNPSPKYCKVNLRNNSKKAFWDALWCNAWQ